MYRIVVESQNPNPKPQTDPEVKRGADQVVVDRIKDQEVLVILRLKLRLKVMMEVMDIIIPDKVQKVVEVVVLVLLVIVLK